MTDDLAHVEYIKLGTVGHGYSQYRVDNRLYLCREQDCRGSNRHARVCWLRRLRGRVEYVVGVTAEGSLTVWSTDTLPHDTRQQLKDVARAHLRRIDTDGAWRWWYELPASDVLPGDWRKYHASSGPSYHVRELMDPDGNVRAYACRNERGGVVRLVLVNGGSGELRAQDAAMIGEHASTIAVELADRHRRYLHGLDDS